MKKCSFFSAALLLFTVAAIFTSCSDDDSKATPVSKTAFVTIVTGPETGAVNQELSFTVTFAVDNNCGAFDKVVETGTPTAKTIEVKAKYVGNNCDTTPTTKTTVYKFKPTETGTFSLKFKKSATEFITKSVVVS